MLWCDGSTGHWPYLSSRHSPALGHGPRHDGFAWLAQEAALRPFVSAAFSAPLKTDNRALASLILLRAMSRRR